MSTRILFVVGLPASGKSTYLAHREAQEARRGTPMSILDDPTSKLAIASQIEAWRERTGILGITSPHFCIRPQLDMAIQIAHKAGFSPTEIEIVFFQNDPAQCLINAARPDRKKKKVNNYILQLQQIYDPPAEFAIPVYRD